MTDKLARYKTILFNTIELLVVLVLGFGIFWRSNSKVLYGGTFSTSVTMSSKSFYILVILEAILLLAISSFLQFRKWELKDFNLDFKWYFPGIALFLVISRFGLGTLFEQLFGLAGFDLGEPVHLNLEASLLSCLLVIVINSIYEEVLLLGYLFKRLENLSPVLVIIISMVIRESYHLYQGWYKLPMAISIGLVYGWYYYRYKKLWPPILAHGISNAFVFLYAHYGWEW